MHDHGVVPASIQARLARGALRAARKAAENGKCAVTEMLLALGGGGLRLAIPRVRGIGSSLKTLNGQADMAEAASAMISCKEREGKAAPPGPTVTP